MEEDDTDILRKAIQEATEEFCPNSNDFFAITPLESMNNFMDESVPVLDFDPASFVAHVPAIPLNVNPLIIQHRHMPGATVPDLSPAPSSTDAASAPLGSQLNPIELIQEGNTYRTTHALTDEQLQQVGLLLQQQRQEQLTAEPKTSGIVYNAANNTKIIYHVIQPDSLDSSDCQSNDSTAPVSLPTKTKSVLKPWGRRRLEAEKEEADRVEGELLTREEKDRQKSQLARTRSGRVSKPPSYMVKDFKYIHRLDFDEEDACDAGYSDLGVADATGAENEKSVEISAGLAFDRRRDHKCVTCNKAYIGNASLSRHYRLYPAHASAESDTNRNSKVQSVDVPPRLKVLADEKATIAAKSVSRKQRARQYLGWYWNRGLLRRKPPRQRNGGALQKPSLKQLLSCYSNEELLADGMAELSKVAGTWEFLDTKCKQQPLPDQYIAKLYKELENLTEQTSKVSKGCLEPCAEASGSESSRLHVTNEVVAKLLGISVGSYLIKKDDGSAPVPPPPSPGPPEPESDTGLDAPSSTSSSSRCSVSSYGTSASSCVAGEDSEAPETEGDSNHLSLAGSTWSPAKQAHANWSSREETLSPSLEYRTRLCQLNLAKDEGSLPMVSTLPAAAVDDNAVEPEDMAPKRDMHAEYLSRLAECKLMEEPSDATAGDRGLSFVSCCLELPAGLLGDESQLPGDVSELAGDDEPEMPGTLDGILRTMTASLSERGSPCGATFHEDKAVEAMDVSTLDETRPLDKDFDILELLDREANSSAMQRQLQEGACSSYTKSHTLIVIDDGEDN